MIPLFDFFKLLPKIFFLIILLLLPKTEIYARQHKNVLYHSLDPKSVSAHLAFYRLFPQDPLGKKALQEAMALLTGHPPQHPNAPLSTPLPLIDQLIEIVNRPPENNSIVIKEEELAWIQSLAQPLKNRALPGFKTFSEEDILRLADHEIDLARALLISQMQEDLDENTVLSYEAIFDLMALQIQARLPKQPTPAQTIEEMNRFVFEEMHFRFPPHSLYAKDIDLYTFLPSVVDSRRGVCLGVSILYLCLAQRLGLPLEIITPPGHIFVRYERKNQVINIETTCRGVDMPDEQYLGIDTRALERRTVKEVVGMAHVNHASIYWQNNEFEKAIACYEIARKYMPNDLLVKELLGYNYLFAGQEERGKALLQEVQGKIPEHAVTKSFLIEEYLEGKVGAEGILHIYKRVDQTRDSILQKKEQLLQTLNDYPEFRSGWFQLAVTHLQLHNAKEALRCLEICHNLQPDDPTCEYYLSMLHAERLNLPKAWEHYTMAEEITKGRDHYPRALKQLKLALIQQLIP